MEVPRRKEGLHVREIDGETVILDPQTEQMHTLNVTAAFVFQAIDGKRALKEIADEVARHFEVDAGTADSDTREIVRQFSELKLLV